MIPLCLQEEFLTRNVKDFQFFMLKEWKAEKREIYGTKYLDWRTWLVGSLLLPGRCVLKSTAYLVNNQSNATFQKWQGSWSSSLVITCNKIKRYEVAISDA